MGGRGRAGGVGGRVGSGGIAGAPGLQQGEQLTSDGLPNRRVDENDVPDSMVNMTFFDPSEGNIYTRAESRQLNALGRDIEMRQLRAGVTPPSGYAEETARMNAEFNRIEAPAIARWVQRQKANIADEHNYRLQRR